MDALRRYKLTNYDVKFLHEYCEKSRADVEIYAEEESIIVRFSTDWYIEPDGDEEYILVTPTKKNIDDAAKHEVRHVVLRPLTAMLERYGADNDDIEHLEHLIIEKLGNYDKRRK